LIYPIIVKFNINQNRSKNLGPRPGAKVIKPKNAKLVARNRLIKKHTSGMTASTEKNLAERAGHLELLKGGKKDKKRSAQDTKTKK